MSDVILLDGGMGTMLQAAGMPAGEHPEVFTYEYPEVLKEVHKKYIDAGSDIIYANTFGANAHKLEGCSIDTRTAIYHAIKIAKEAVAESGRSVRVALDIGPIGELLEPLGTLCFEDAYEIYKEVIVYGADAGADIIVIETFTDLYDAKAALLAAKENSSLPVYVTMTFEKNARTFTGTTIPAMALTLEGLGADAIGFNCSLGPKEILEFTKSLREWTTLPILIKPNAGLPNPSTGEYDLSDKDFAVDMREYLSLGVMAMGGCCGTNPNYIRLLKEEVEKYAIENPNATVPKAIQKIRYGVCSANTVAEFGGVRVVGERLNPTGKKRFAQALLEHDMDYITKIALEQEEAGADILDVNVGVPGADEVSLMIEVVKAVQSIVSIPLQIDSSNEDAIEAGLRVYNGRAIVNSVNADDSKLEKILPIIKKYGASVVGLTMDEEGIPDTAEKRFDKAKYIMDKALEYGIKKEDLIIDCLTLTVSAQQEQARETLTAVQRVSKELGLHCTLGVSNISFGLPARSHITENFLIQAMQAGLDFPIINPNIEGLMDAVSGFKVLSGEDVNSEQYIAKYANTNKENKPVIKSDTSDQKLTIEEAILKGLKSETKALAMELLESMTEIELIQSKLIPALDIVGDQYEKQILFLPQLINSANAASEAFELIKERIAKQGGETVERGKIAVATVKGDIHDIGKNIVKVILENYGYRMFDLGRDVPVEKVVDTVIREDINLVGLSALMTTTLPAMKETIEALKKIKPDIKVWVGGAVLTPEYAKDMGADFYAKDARASVDIAKKVLGE